MKALAITDALDTNYPQHILDIMIIYTLRDIMRGPSDKLIMRLSHFEGPNTC